MNTNRRGTGRKSQNVPRESNTQDISQFVHRRSKEELVEIDDDDEVQDLTDQFAFAEEELQPILVKRRKKHLIFEDSDDDLDEMKGMDEDEKRQMKEAIRQSKLQMEVEDKRRATSATKSVNLISESEPDKSGRAKDNKADSEDETQDYLTVQSSPANSGVEKQQMDRVESPDLFGTPSNDKEEPENIPDKACSPSKSPFKSFSTDDLKSRLDKDMVINLTPIKRQFDSNTKSKLKLKKKEPSKDQEKEAENKSKFKSTDQSENDSTVESKKRKYILDDEDDGTEDTGRECVIKDPKKKQKTIEQVLNVKHGGKNDRQKSRTLDPLHVVVGDDDDNDNDDDDAEGSMEDDGKVNKRNDPSPKMKKSSTTRLERAYSTPRLSIKTIKEAMKARLYFAPPGIDPKTYTYAIMRMMDQTRKRILRAQRKSLTFIKWGKPVMVGPRETNSLDARKEKKKSDVNVASTSAISYLEAPSSERRRTLRSAQTSTVAPPIKSEPVTISTREDSSKVRKDYLDSDESDDDLTKPVFGEPTSKPKPWKEYLSTKETETFGENVVTSTEYEDKSVDASTVKSVPLATNAASSSFTGFQDMSKNVAATKQNELDKNDVECIDGKKLKINERLENSPNTQRGVDLESKTKTNDEYAEISWIGQDDVTKVKQMEEQKTMFSELFDKEEEEIDSSIEIGMNKPKKHTKKALIDDVEDEEKEESRGPLSMFGTEVEDDDVVERDHDLHIATARDSKPGASLTNVATLSGYLKVERTPTEIPRVQRLMSSAARSAAEAAEKRLKASSLQSSPDISSSIEPSQEIIPSSLDSRVECPICFCTFYKEDIEAHAATCDEITPRSNPTSFSPRKPTTSSESQKSFGSPADNEEPKNKDFGLKNLRVMVTRSPEAHRRLLEQKTEPSPKARRNLSLNKATRRASSTSNQGSENKSSRKFIDITIDDENNPEIKKEDLMDEKEMSEENSPSANWFSTTASQMERRKNKFKVTYGGKKKNQVDPRTNPFATLDHLHLGEYPSSGDYDVGDIKDTDDEEEKCGMLKMQKMKGVTNDATVMGASTGPAIKKDMIPCDKYGDIESDSDKSDIEMLATYGVKVESKKRKFEDKKSINDILRPRRQENPKKKMKKTEGDFDNDDYENEMALLELSGVTIKQRKVENKPNERSTRRRHRRISSSEESEDNNDDFESCFICFKKIPKEDYKNHTDTCLEKKGEFLVTPGKGSCDTANPDIRSRSRSSVKQGTAGSSEQTIEMDSDEIGDSPVKTFKLIGEDSGSCVDFSNQFAFFNKGSESRRKSRGNGRNKGGKYKWKGRYKRGRGKRKH